MAARIVRLFGLLLILTAVAVALSRAPDVPVRALVARWGLPPSDFIEVKGQLVHFRDEGPRNDPTPIVLLHGTGDSLHAWEGWVTALKSRHRVIRMDLPAFGLTGPFTGEYAADDYRADTYARFVLDVLDAMQVPRAVIGGNSLGGEIAWRAVTIAPARFDKLILVDATGYPVAGDAIPLVLRLARLPVLGRVGEYLLPRALVAASVRSVFGDPARVTDPLVDRYFELSLREGNRHALSQVLRQFEPGEHSTRIATLALPTLVLWGGLDQLLPPVNGQRFASDIPGAKLIVFDGLGHVPHEEDPAATAAAVAAFLQPAPR